MREKNLKKKAEFLYYFLHLDGLLDGSLDGKKFNKKEVIENIQSALKEIVEDARLETLKEIISRENSLVQLNDGSIEGVFPINVGLLHDQVKYIIPIIDITQYKAEVYNSKRK